MSEQIIAQQQYTIQLLTAKEKTYIQVVQEYLSANINLRTANVLHEETLKNLHNEIAGLSATIESMKKEKESLEKRLEEPEKLLNKK